MYWLQVKIKTCQEVGCLECLQMWILWLRLPLITFVYCIQIEMTVSSTACFCGLFCLPLYCALTLWICLLRAIKPETALSHFQAQVIVLFFCFMLDCIYDSLTAAVIKQNWNKQCQICSIFEVSTTLGWIMSPNMQAKRYMHQSDGVLALPHSIWE